MRSSSRHGEHVPSRFAFPPGAPRAAQLDRDMHRQLGSSLDHLRAQCAGVVAFDAPGLDHLVEEIGRGRRFLPGLFGDYYALVAAIVRDDLRGAADLFARVIAAAPAPAIMTVVPLDACDRADQYKELMESDGQIGMLAPSAARHAAFVVLLGQVMALIDAVMPALGGEIRGLVRELVTVAGDQSRPMLFDGGSHYQLWGALFLNIERHASVAALIEALAHECAHSLLFGLSGDEMLVENGDDELFASPLRPDPRPMDGIFHATFVAARMHLAMERLADSDLADDDARSYARDAAIRARASFESGHDIVRRHGRLTATGRAIMAGAAGYIARATGPRGLAA